MCVTALGHIGIRSDKLDGWSDFAGGPPGMQRIGAAARGVRAPALVDCPWLYGEPEEWRG